MCDKKYKSIYAFSWPEIPIIDGKKYNFILKIYDKESPDYLKKKNITFFINSLDEKIGTKLERMIREN